MGGADNPDLLALCLSLSKDFPETWLLEVLQKAHKGQSETEIVDALLSTYNLVYNEKTGFYEYDNSSGIWVHLDDTALGAYIREYLGAVASAKKLFSLTEHMKRATVSNAPLFKFNRLELFAFRNGTLHFKGEGNSIANLLKPASPDDFVTSRRSFDFDAAAKCPEWEHALQVIFDGDTKRTLCFQKFCGYALMPHCKFHKASYLRGSGRNGKSTLLNVVRALFGDDNSTSLEPSDFADKFSLVHLKDALINICTDAKTILRGRKLISKRPLQVNPSMPATNSKTLSRSGRALRFSLPATMI